MDFKKVIIYGFFGVIAGILFSCLAAVGGFIGAGSGLLVSALIGNVLIGSLVGGAVAALAFHALIKGIDSFLIKAAEEKEKKGGSGVKPPSLAQDKRYLWGSVSYFITTVIGVNLFHAFFTSPAWFTIATIVGSGALGLLGLGVVVWLKLWDPSFKERNEKR